jgi:arsenate reductase
MALLEENNIAATVIEYLQNPPTTVELSDILAGLNMTPLELMRTGEDEYKSAKDEISTMTDAEATKWLCANPKVIERPIVVSDKGVRIGRPPESILEIL